MQKSSLEEILAKKSREDLLDLTKTLQIYEDKHRYNKLEFLWSDEFKKNYPKHVIFIKAGAVYRERLLIAANRIGKTRLACMEDAFQITGKYPLDWEGKKFNEPITAWISGKTHSTTRDILQKYLLGPRSDIGSGFIPRDDIVRTTTKPGTPDAILDVYVKHYTNGIYDGESHLVFKSEDQKVEAFYGDEVHLIHLDEEHSNSIYSECLIRTTTTKGIIIHTFTPKKGMTDVVLRFMPNGTFPTNGMGEVNGASDE